MKFLLLLLFVFFHFQTSHGLEAKQSTLLLEGEFYEDFSSEKRLVELRIFEQVSSRKTDLYTMELRFVGKDKTFESCVFKMPSLRREIDTRASEHSIAGVISNKCQNVKYYAPALGVWKPYITYRPVLEQNRVQLRDITVVMQSVEKNYLLETKYQ